MTHKINREERIQRAVVQHLTLCLPENVVWYSVPNAPRNAVSGGRLKATGMRAGVADLAFVLPGGKSAFIEMKCEKDHQGDRTYIDADQRAFRDQVRLAGGLYAVCRSSEEVMETLGSWGVQFKHVRYARNDNAHHEEALR